MTTCCITGLRRWWVVSECCPHPSLCAGVGANSKQPRKGAVITDTEQPFDDLQLGPLLGQGSFGKVYRGMWSGAPVAVKVRR